MTRDFINITLINMLVFIAWHMMVPTLPLYIKSLNGSDLIVGVASLIGTCATLVVSAFAGVSLDRFGRRGILFIGLMILIFSAAVYSWFPVIGALLLIRAFHGLGWGIFNTTSNTVASNVIPKSRFGEGMGFFGSSQSIAMAFALGIGIMLLNTLGFRILTFAVVGCTMVGLIFSMCIQYRKVDKPAEKKKFAPYERSAVYPSLIMACISSAFGSVMSFISLYGKSLSITSKAILLEVYIHCDIPT